MTILRKPFYIIRHGQTHANADKVMSGQVDTPLTDLGISQARDAAKIMRQLDPKPSVVIHSHLSRARDTAGFLNEGLGLDMVEEAMWAEQDFGLWQGTAYAETQDLLRSGETPPEGESRAVFYERVRAVATETLNRYELPLIVCHGGVIRAISAAIGYKVQGIKNCVLYEFQPDIGANSEDVTWSVFEYAAPEGHKSLSPLFHGEGAIKIAS